MPAVILNHSSHEVKLKDPRDPFVREDRPVTPASVESALDACNGERSHVRLLGVPTTLVPYPHADDPWARSVAIDHLVKLMAEFGAATVARWVRNQAARMGVDINGQDF